MSLPLTSTSATSVESAVCAFVVDVLGAGVDVFPQGVGAVPSTAPYAVVSVIADIDDTPTITVLDTDAGTVGYRSHRQVTAQVAIRGGYESMEMAQRLAILWRSDSPARRSSVTRGLAPSTVGQVRRALTDGGAETVVGATVDLTGYYSQTVSPISDPDATVDAINADLTGARDGEPDATFDGVITDGAFEPTP